MTFDQIGLSATKGAFLCLLAAGLFAAIFWVPPALAEQAPPRWAVRVFDTLLALFILSVTAAVVMMACSVAFRPA